MKPRIILHNVVSLDGRIDGFTPDIELFYELASRWHEDATLAGSNTICRLVEPIPAETDEDLMPPVVDPADQRPLLVVPDSRGRVRHWHYLRRQPYWRGMVSLCSRATPAEHREYLKARHIECIVAGVDRVDLPVALQELHARHGVKTIRVDSGGRLNGVLLRAGLVDEVSVLIQPCLVGGTSLGSIVRFEELAASEGPTDLRLTHVERLRADAVWLRYEVVRPVPQ